MLRFEKCERQTTILDFKKQLLQRLAPALELPQNTDDEFLNKNVSLFMQENNPLKQGYSVRPSMCPVKVGVKE